MLCKTESEKTALAMLRSGSSWKDAADYTGIPVSKLREIAGRGGLDLKQQSPSGMKG